MSPTPSSLQKTRFLSWLPIFLMQGFLGIIRLLPLILCFRLGECLGLLVYRFFPPYRHLAQKNLSIALASKHSLSERKKLARRHFQVLGANLLCSIKIPALSPAALRKVLTIEDERMLREVIDRDHAPPGILVALSHFGNWEMNAQIAMLLHTRSAGTIYQKLKNQQLNDLVNKARHRGVRTFDRKRDLAAALNFLREGGLLGILIDQHAGDAGIWIPFFKKLASTSPLAATLAQRTGALLIHATIHTIGPARWSLRMNTPTRTEGRSIAEITYDLGCQLAEEIKKSPADWFWVHNRWKLPYPAFLLEKVKRGYYIPEDIELKPFKLLVRSPNWLGDACMAAPTLCALKQGRPDMHLTVLSPQKLEALWKSFPQIDEVISIAPKSSPWTVAEQLKACQEEKDEPPFDAALLLPNSLRVALEVWLAKIPRRLGRVRRKEICRGWFINQPFPEEIYRSHCHQADEYRALASWLGASSLR